MKLAKDDFVDEVFLISDGDEVSVEYRKKEINLTKLKLAHRDSKGSKIK